MVVVRQDPTLIEAELLAHCKLHLTQWLLKTNEVIHFCGDADKTMMKGSQTLSVDVWISRVFA